MANRTINYTQRIDIIDSFDPRLTGLAGKKGTTFRYIPAVGTPELLIKTDDGFSVNWLPVGGSALSITVATAASVANVNLASAPANLDGVAGVMGDFWLIKNQTAPSENGVYVFDAAASPLVRATAWDQAGDFIPGRQVFVDQGTVNADTLWADADYVTTLDVDPVVFIRVSSSVVVGDPDTGAFFDSAGNLSSNVDFTFDQVAMAMSFALKSGGGTVTAGANAVLVFGTAGAGSSLSAVANNSLVHGQALTGSSISASSIGSEAFGQADTSGAIQTTGSAVGSIASGHASGGTISAEEQGSVARGRATSQGIIQASGIGAQSSGLCENITSAISATGTGSQAFGYALFAGVLTATSTGSLAFGFVNDAFLVSNNFGSLAFGSSIGGSNSRILSDGAGAVAHGSVVAGGSPTDGVIANAAGAVATGVVNTGSVTASGSASSARGLVTASGSVLAQGDGSTAFGSASGVGSFILASGTGSSANGLVDTGGTITASGNASSIHGSASGGTTNLTAIGDGSLIFGLAVNGTSRILASVTGALAFGVAANNGELVSTGGGACVHGVADTGSISSSGQGSIAAGSTHTSGAIVASADGAFALGRSTHPQCTVVASAFGAIAHGFCGAGSGGKGVKATANGALAGGDVTDGSVLAQGLGSHAHGRSGTTNIEANGTGSTAAGVNENGSIIAGGNASMAIGYAADGVLCTVSGHGAIAIGHGFTSTSYFSATFGEGQINSSYASLMTGRFGVCLGTANAWVDTDPLFVLGIGTGVGTEENAFSIDKNANVHLLRTITAGGTTGAQTIDKPAGSVNFAALATSLVVTNNLVTVDSIILCTIQTNDATAILKNVVAGAGSFTINLTAAATAETKVSFLVIN